MCLIRKRKNRNIDSLINNYSYKKRKGKLNDSALAGVSRFLENTYFNSLFSVSFKIIDLKQGGLHMYYVYKTGIFQNSEKQRWEYWYVGPNEVRILVSWLSWTAFKEYEKWEKNCLVEKAG